MKLLNFAALLFLLTACDGGLWNNPYPAADKNKSIFYTAFAERPKHLDPARAYSENEYVFLAQIYQPPLQYHYLNNQDLSSNHLFLQLLMVLFVLLFHHI